MGTCQHITYLALLISAVAIDISSGGTCIEAVSCLTQSPTIVMLFGDSTLVVANNCERIQPDIIQAAIDACTSTIDSTCTDQGNQTLSNYLLAINSSVKSYQIYCGEGCEGVDVQAAIGDLTSCTSTFESFTGGSVNCETAQGVLDCMDTAIGSCSAPVIETYTGTVITSFKSIGAHCNLTYQGETLTSDEYDCSVSNFLVGPCFRELNQLSPINGESISLVCEYFDATTACFDEFFTQCASENPGVEDTIGDIKQSIEFTQSVCSIDCPYETLQDGLRKSNQCVALTRDTILSQEDLETLTSGSELCTELQTISSCISDGFKDCPELYESFKMYAENIPTQSNGVTMADYIAGSENCNSGHRLLNHWISWVILLVFYILY